MPAAPAAARARWSSMAAREGARVRKARQRASDRYANARNPSDITECTEWIDRRLAAFNAARRRLWWWAVQWPAESNRGT